MGLALVLHLLFLPQSFSLPEFRDDAARGNAEKVAREKNWNGMWKNFNRQNVLRPYHSCTFSSHTIDGPKKKRSTSLPFREGCVKRRFYTLCGERGKKGKCPHPLLFVAQAQTMCSQRCMGAIAVAERMECSMFAAPQGIYGGWYVKLCPITPALDNNRNKCSRRRNRELPLLGCC